MRNPLRRAVRRGLELTGLMGLYYRRLERDLSHVPGQVVDDGRPMPPADLMVLVAGAADQAWFSERGAADAERFLALAARHGLDRAGPLDVWDLGCGCGRIARWSAPQVIAAGGSFQGSDINGRLVAWCAQKLPGTYVVNRLTPPVKLPAASMDLIYAHSVLTHLREKGARAWLAETARVLRPGGVALLTFHDEDYARAWGPAQVQPLVETQDYVVWNDALEGSNYLSAWTTQRYFTQMAQDQFEVLEIIPGDRQTAIQATAVLRRKP